MSGTSIKRKVRKNRVKAKQRQEAVRRLTKKPVLKNVDIETIKEDFIKTSKPGKSAGDKPVKKEEVKEAEIKMVEKQEQPVKSATAEVMEKAEVKKPGREIEDKKEVENLSSSEGEEENPKEKEDQSKK